MEYTVNDTHVTVEHGLGFEGYLSHLPRKMIENACIF